MIARWLLICAVCMAPALSRAQGFAGLGTAADGFAVPQRGSVLVFPRDHGPHPEYRIEWWYLTANLSDANGVPYGVQWTLFRSALAPRTRDGWSDPQLWFAHAAVTSKDRHLVAERFARGGIGQAGVTAEPFTAWIDDWHMRGPEFAHMRGPEFARLSLRASGPAFTYDLDLRAMGPLVQHGDAGYSVKSPEGQASYYYSQPFFAVEGMLDLPERKVAVTGTAWLDREWSSQPLSDGQTGWDWFSISFSDGAKLMGFGLRERDGAVFTSGTWIAADGTAEALAPGVFRADPVAISDVGGRDIPTTWRVQVPSKSVDITVAALNPQAWMDVALAYWEGPVTVSGSHEGRGYLEMTGYE